MRRKLISQRISACPDCLYHQRKYDKPSCYCLKADKNLPNCASEIPDWCPLPDAPETKTEEK